MWVPTKVVHQRVQIWNLLHLKVESDLDWEVEGVTRPLIGIGWVGQHRIQRGRSWGVEMLLHQRRWKVDSLFFKLIGTSSRGRISLKINQSSLKATWIITTISIIILNWIIVVNTSKIFNKYHLYSSNRWWNSTYRITFHRNWCRHKYTPPSNTSHSSYPRYRINRRN